MQLDLFREGWTHHPLRTEGNWTLQQLWIMGLDQLMHQNPDHTAVAGLFEVGTI